jgi:recombination protein RecA
MQPNTHLKSAGPKPQQRFKTERETKLKEICDIINKGTFGGEKHDAVTYVGADDVIPIERFSTGCPELDDALGGGWPKGRQVELSGAESTGKTTMVYHAIAEYQKKYPTDDVALIDAEHSTDESYAQALGVDMRYLLVNQPDSAEQALNIVSLFIQNGVKLIVVDSVAALTPKSELEGDVGVGSGMAEQARIMSQALRRLTTEAGSHDVTILWTNQIREKLGVLWGDKTTTPAGRALKHYASVRVKFNRIGTVREDVDGEKIAVCIRVKAEVAKSKVSPPFRTAEFYISFGKGVDGVAALLDAAMARSVIVRRGAWFALGDEQLGQGRMAVLDRMRQDEELRNKISAAIEQAKVQGVKPNPEIVKVPRKIPKAITEALRRKQAGEEEPSVSGEETEVQDA